MYEIPLSPRLNEVYNPRSQSFIDAKKGLSWKEGIVGLRLY